MKNEQFTFDNVTLTLQEMRIVALHCKALTQQKMSEALGNKPGTVRNLVANIYNKLNIHKCTELVARALQWGFTPDGLFRGRDLLKGKESA